MSLRQMEYLLAVVEHSSFTRAAETLNVTQSALSHQLKALEREVGGALLERLPRAVRLTPMGRAFLPHAELAVRGARQARRAARAAAGVQGGELHLATLHSVAIGRLPGVLARWRRERAGVGVVLHEYATTDELRDQMERGVADLGVGPVPAGWPGPVVPLGDEEIVLVVPADDPLAGRGSVRLAELADRDWVRCALEPVVEGRAFLDWACGRAGFAPRTAIRTEQTSTAVRMAAEGAGIVLASLEVAAAANCAVVPMDPPWRRPLSAFARVELSGAAEAFVRLLRQGDGGSVPRSAGPHGDALSPAQKGASAAGRLGPGASSATG